MIYSFGYPSDDNTISAVENSIKKLFYVLDHEIQAVTEWIKHNETILNCRNQL